MHFNYSTFFYTSDLNYFLDEPKKKEMQIRPSVRCNRRPGLYSKGPNGSEQILGSETMWCERSVHSLFIDRKIFYK